ncbi:MAG TPA: ThiF family adenylyltransferase [Nitrolancea sp.]|jgi:molybdopterin/thiamine biosynthesis adenylyltransferase|nr:ThiF family adenylyltransferase [Nitrolancea sp.]
MTANDGGAIDQTSTSGIRVTLAGGEDLQLPPHDEFYAQLITRNEGLVSDDEQRQLREATILVAGCGSIGGAVVEPLVRIGAEHLILAEPGDYDIHNLNRQSMTVRDIGRNKAEVLREQALSINPYASVEVDTRGIVDENVVDLVKRATIIIDGVDVTTKPPLRMKLALHEHAQRVGIPVISGYDIAGLQMMKIYDYRQPGTKVLDGRIRPNGPELTNPMGFLRRVVPIAALPHEIIGELSRQLRGERSGFPQIVYTANLFGVMTLPALIDLLQNRPVRRRIIVDVPTLLRPRARRMQVAASRWVGLFHLNNEFRRSRKQPDVAEDPAVATGE